MPYDHPFDDQAPIGDAPEFPNQAPIAEERRARFAWANERRSRAQPKHVPPDKPEDA